ncbi:hypothetical protein Tco_0216158 [Tanacetum coccineum]
MKKGPTELADDVTFKIHYDEVFQLRTPLTYVNGQIFGHCFSAYLTVFRYGKLIDSDKDVHSLYDFAETHGTVEVYIAHLPQNLATYYFNNLELDGSDEEVTSKRSVHEKQKKYANTMSYEELIAWAEEEANSLYLRSPPLKSRPLRKDLKGKVLFTDTYNQYEEGFEHYPFEKEDEQVNMPEIPAEIGDEIGFDIGALDKNVCDTYLVDNVGDTCVVDNVGVDNEGVDNEDQQDEVQREIDKEVLA